MNLLRIAARIVAGKGTCVYVDLDETLIHTVNLKAPEHLAVFKKFAGEKLQNGSMGTMLRPGALEFVDSLRQYGPVYLLTMSTSEYANALAAMFGFDVDAIFPRESLGGRVGAGETKFVLVDDLNPLHPYIQIKLAAMGVPEYVEPEREEYGDETEAKAQAARAAYYSKWVVAAPEFQGSMDDAGLVGITERVGQALAAQD